MTAILNIWNVITAAIYLMLLHSRLSHLTDKRQEHVVVGFVVAGLYSVGLVQFLYVMYPVHLAAVFSVWDFAYHVLVVGMVEESGKFLVFLFLVHVIGHIREPQDGVIYGAIVGLTFGFIENIAYFSWYESWFLAVRPVISSGGHAIYGAIWGGLYSQAVYANRSDPDVRVRRNAVFAIASVALIHGIYNATTRYLALATLLDGLALVVAVVLFRRLVEESPYRVYPLSRSAEAIRSLRRGLFFNPRSSYLNRNIGLYLMHMGHIRSAAEHLRASVPRSRDPRRAQFLAAACESVYVPRYHAHRALRIAWARLTDGQRTTYLNQLVRLVGPDHLIVENVNDFITNAFQPRRIRRNSEIALTAKRNRWERRRNGAADLTPDERRRLWQQFQRIPSAGR
ncbi:MAG: PrsW family glutamic-type intramembrane protease [Spirochaeta sp.]|jgi:RsiW-degrading membrane proteinase PrsW (M82 family)|nr:PrsW family glutamic-type intramembrane protease [Spirochaeta sp.]